MRDVVPSNLKEEVYVKKSKQNYIQKQRLQCIPHTCIPRTIIHKQKAFMQFMLYNTCIFKIFEKVSVTKLMLEWKKKIRMTLESLTPRIAYKMQNTSLYKGGGETAPLTVSPSPKERSSLLVLQATKVTPAVSPPPPPPPPRQSPDKIAKHTISVYAWNISILYSITLQMLPHEYLCLIHISGHIWSVCCTKPNDIPFYN